MADGGNNLVVELTSDILIRVDCKLDECDRNIVFVPYMKHVISFLSILGILQDVTFAYSCAHLIDASRLVKNTIIRWTH